MKLIQIAYYEMIKNFRDIKLILLIIIAPIILIFILGKSLDAFISMDYMKKPVIGFVNMDQGDYGKQIETYLLSDDIKDLVNIRIYHSKDEADAKIEEKEISSIIYVEDNYSSLITQGDVAPVYITGSSSTTFAESILNGYINSFNLTKAINQNNGDIQLVTNEITLERAKVNEKSLFPKAIDYYAIQTLLQILPLTAICGISIILRDKDNGLKTRIASLPIHQNQLIIGRIIGSITYAFIASIVTILFSKYVYGANWNGNPIWISISILLYIIIVIGMGALFAQLTKSFASSFGLIMVVSMIFSSSTGAFSPKVMIREIAVISPNLYAKNILFATIYGLPNQLIVNGIIGLSVLTIIIYSLIFLLEGRKKHDYLCS